MARDRDQLSPTGAMVREGAKRSHKTQTRARALAKRMARHELDPLLSFYGQLLATEKPRLPAAHCGFVAGGSFSQPHHRTNRI